MVADVGGGQAQGAADLGCCGDPLDLQIFRDALAGSLHTERQEMNREEREGFLQEMIGFSVLKFLRGLYVFLAAFVVKCLTLL